MPRFVRHNNCGNTGTVSRSKKTTPSGSLHIFLLLVSFWCCWVFCFTCHHECFGHPQMKTFRNIMLYAVIVALSSCANSNNSSNKPETDQCRISKSMHQICIGNCLMVTPGETLTALGICGNKCTKEFVEMSVYCN